MMIPDLMSGLGPAECTIGLFRQLQFRGLGILSHCHGLLGLGLLNPAELLPVLLVTPVLFLL